jgi:outer membrane receptor protein involved in Fe transport
LQAAEPATLFVYLFDEGKPLAQVEMVTDEEIQQSNRDGYAKLVIPAGLQRLLFRQQGTPLLELSLALTDGEQVELLVTTYRDGRKPLVEFVSSNPDTLLPEEDPNSPDDKPLQDAKDRGAIKASPNAPQPQAIGTGTISGEVLSLETHKPVAGAHVFISGIKQEIKTDAQGQFKVDVPVGEYSLSILHRDFSTQTKNNLNITANGRFSEHFSLSPIGEELPEHVVIEPNLAGSLAAIMEEQKSTSAVTSVLGTEQITRAGDSDAAGALRRATGLTLVGGKFAYIRGLGERYATTLLNNASIPSPDPTRRVVPLDLFPTSVLQGIEIQKSYSVDRPAEFAGGTIELKTRTVPDSFFFNGNYQLGLNEGTSFADGLTYQGGDLDVLGADDDARALPSSLESALAGGSVLRPQTVFNPNGFSSAQMDTFGRDLSGTWDINRETIGPDHRISLSMGDKFTFNDFSFGYTGALRWSDAWNTQQEQLKEFSVNEDSLDLIGDYRLDKTEREVQTNAYLGLEAQYLDHHKLHGNAIMLRQTFDEARITEGYTDADATDIKRSRLREIENSLIVGQFGGEHTWDFLSDIKTDWLITQASADRDAPNEREYRYDRAQDDRYYFSRRADSNQLNFSELSDGDESYRLDVSIPLNVHPDVEANLKSGFIDQHKERDSAIRRFSFSPAGADARNPTVLGQNSLEQVLSDQNIGTNGFVLSEITRATDNYKAEQSLFSYYGQADLTLFNLVRFTGGVRVEDNKQEVKTFELFNLDNKPILSGLTSTDLLPSIASTWLINDQQQLRASFSETLSRPDFRELSPAPFTDPANDRETVGNPRLQQTSVSNVDLRYEYYFSDTENFSIGYFNKDLSNPIEKILLPGPGGLLTLQNAQSANVYGLETEIMKNLDFILPELEYFYIGANYTWTRSEIILKPENLTTQTTNYRPLEGHSPYVINVQIGYNHPDKGTTATLLFNTAGKRIAEVGSLGAPDKYEQPVHQVDFVWRQQLLEHVTLTFNARNLLDDQIEVYQGDKTTRSYRNGREFRLGVNIDY